ncbi:uncharacterized protein ACNLHF_021682 isoform 1-T1 [Anomaloglossus baeobatrachus]
MDYRSRESSWTDHLSKVFNGDIGLNGGSGHDTTLELQKNLKTLMYKRTKLWWNGGFLKNYFHKRLVPRGLRIQIFPSFPVDDKNFVSQWEDVCTNTSLKFIELLMDLNKQKLGEVEKNIDEQISIFTTNATAAQVTSFNLKMEQNFDTWEKEIQDNQSRKLNRDLQDVQNNRVYRWHSKTNNPTFRGRSISISSISSGGQSDNTTSSVTTRSNTTKRKWNQKHNGNKNIGESSTDALKVINLSHHVFSEADLSVLSKGLSFSPCNSFDLFAAVKDLNIFARSLIHKKWFHDEDLRKQFPSNQEQEALRILEELAVEHSTDVLVSNWIGVY